MKTPEEAARKYASDNGFMHDVWLSPQDFEEFLDECKRLYQDNETRKNKQPEAKK